MYKFFATIFMLLNIIGITNDIFAQNLIGPKIHGFCLGMTIEEIKNTAIGENYTVGKSELYDRKDSPAFEIKNKGQDIAVLNFGYNNDNVRSMMFPVTAFNTIKIDENFIIQFLKNYKIPVDQNLIRQSNDTLTVPIPSEGYEILFERGYAGMGGDVKIRTITKSSDLNFK